jgi:hypothetical protein
MNMRRPVLAVSAAVTALCTAFVPTGAGAAEVNHSTSWPSSKALAHRPDG